MLFENPMGIPLLLRFYDFRCNPWSKTILIAFYPSGGICSCTSLLARMEKYFDLVRDAVVEHLDTHSNLNEVAERQNEWLRVANSEALKRLRYLLKDLEHNHYQKQEVSIDEAVDIWEKLV